MTRISCYQQLPTLPEYWFQA